MHSFTLKLSTTPTSSKVFIPSQIQIPWNAMSVLEERDAYLRSPYFEKHEYGDFTPFYVTVTILTIIGVALFVLNIALGCCSRYSGYWNDRHTGKVTLYNFVAKT